MRDELLAEREITIDRLEQLFNEAEVVTERAANGNLVLKDSDVNAVLSINPAASFIQLTSYWIMPKHVSDVAKVTYFNVLNKQFMLVRFFMYDSETMVCQVHVITTGGLIPQQLISTFRRYVQIVGSAMAMVNRHKIFGPS